jgi:glycosyltransferase involved in cell wall biosynthesis
MNVAFIARATLYEWTGGDTIQVIQTASHLRNMGVSVDIHLTHSVINYEEYDLLHFFNIIRPADILFHIQKTNKPFVVSPILVDYSEYDKHHRTGIAGMIFRFLPRDSIEYLKTIARWLRGKDKLVSKSYLWNGHRRSILEILRRTAFVLPNSQMEYEQLVRQYGINPRYSVIPYAVNTGLFSLNAGIQKDPKLVLCVGQIEGRKNQFTLIKALNNTDYQLLIIGSPAANQQSYYHQCRAIAAKNISFIDHLPQEQLVQYYQKAGIHILPSWFETCGLVTMEAAIMGCNVVITDKGFAREYYGEDAFYCDPSSTASIFRAVEKATGSYSPVALREKIVANYTWQQAASRTKQAYSEIVAR